MLTASSEDKAATDEESGWGQRRNSEQVLAAKTTV